MYICQYGLVIGQDWISSDLTQALDKMFNDIKIGIRPKVTVAEFFKDYLGKSILDLECFVDPNDWGWDKDKFRQLYQTVTIRKEL